MPSPSEPNAFANVELHVSQRGVTLEDLERLVELARGLSPKAEFDLTPVEAGQSFIIGFSENVDTGVGRNDVIGHW